MRAPRLSRRELRNVAIYLAVASLLQMLSRALRLETGSGVWFLVPAVTLAFSATSRGRLLWATFLAPMPHQMILGLWGPALLPASVICLSHGLAYGVGGWALQRFAGLDTSLRRGRDLALLLAACLVLPLGFGIPVGGLFSYLRPAFGSFANRLAYLAAEDAVGLLTLAPALFLLLNFSPRRGWIPIFSNPFLVLETLFQAMALAALPFAVLLQPTGQNFSLEFLGFIPLLWVGLRWGFKGAAVGVMVYDLALGAQYTALGYSVGNLLSIQCQLLVMGTTALIVGHLVSRRKAEEERFAQVDPERMALAAKLAANEAHFRQLVDQSLVPTAIHQSGKFVYMNEAALKLLGLTLQEALGSLVSDRIHPEEREESIAYQRKVLEGSQVEAVERRVLRGDGTVVVVDLLSIPCEHQGRPATQVLAVDLTARKAVEEGLRERIKEKELLIREIHHRVKNNLQVVSSLLRLQASAFPGTESSRALERAQSRIQAISSVHQRLHQTAALAPEELRDYLATLVERLAQTFSESPGGLETTVEAEPLALGADQLVPLGLIVHELVMNALRHAFPEGRKGRLRLGLHAEGNEVALTVEDDGVGLPGTEELPQGLGFQLVKALAEQLKGRLEVDRDGGTTFRLHFPLHP